MKVEIEAAALRVGDVFNGKIVTRSCRSIVDRGIWFFETTQNGTHYRHRSEMMEVERPEPNVTVTIEFTPDEVEYMLSDGGWRSVWSSKPIHKLCAAMEAAR